MIDFTGGHTTVIGITRSGKTYATQKSLLAQPLGVLFFNTQHEEMERFTLADKRNDFRQISKRINGGGKVDYRPDTMPEMAEKELSYIIDNLFLTRTDKPMILAVDEVHLYRQAGLKQCIRLATTGLRFGLTGVWISQRPANIDNTLMTQSHLFVIFDTNMEANYFKRYGIPQEDIQRRIRSGGQYSYCTYDWKTVMGPGKVTNEKG